MAELHTFDEILLKDLERNSVVVLYSGFCKVIA